VHWQANGRPSPPAQATVAGESVLFVDPAEIPAHADVAKLGQALAASPPRGQLYELMVNLAAYAGLRWGELAALTITQIDQAARRSDPELNSSAGATTLINHALMSGDPRAAALLRRPEPPAREPPEREAGP
jgi:hypothetical protein